jgi:hypothetical protein
MKYLVEDYFTEQFYISDSLPDTPEEDYYTSGAYFTLLVPFEEGKMLEALKDHFSKEKKSLDDLGRYKKQSCYYSTDYMIKDLTGDFNDDRFTIEELEESGIINKNEKRILFKEVSKAQKKQFELLKQVFYPEGYKKAMKLINNKKQL